MSFLPDDYEPCGCCSFDHNYEVEEAREWHLANPCSYCKYDQVNEQHEDNCPMKEEKE